MNDLQNALEQLKRRANGQCEAMLPREAQALLDERDTLREACDRMFRNLAAFLLRDDFSSAKERKQCKESLELGRDALA